MQSQKFHWYFKQNNNKDSKKSVSTVNTRTGIKDLAQESFLLKHREKEIFPEVWMASDWA